MLKFSNNCSNNQVLILIHRMRKTSLLILIIKGDRKRWLRMLMELHTTMSSLNLFFQLLFFAKLQDLCCSKEKMTEANLGSIFNFRVNTSCFFTPKQVNICCYLCHTLQLLFGTPTEKYIAPLTHSLSTRLWRHYSLFAQCKRQMFSVDHCTKHTYSFSVSATQM